MSTRPENSYRRTSVSVRGGDLAVGVWGPEDGPAVLAVHGVTASHLTFPLVAARLPDARFIAPDLRGRGRSNGLPGPWGMPQHADDLAAVLDALGVGSAVVLGHSMGAFASLVLAHRHPTRVSSLVLVDGGLPLPTPSGFTDDEITRATLGPAAERLSMTFESRERYREYWRNHPALTEDWSQVIENYIDYDLVGAEPNLRPSSSYEAVAADSVELRGGESLLAALDALNHRATFISAPRGLMNEVPPLYPAPALEAWAAKLPEMHIISAHNVNHYTIVLSERGAKVVADAVASDLAAAKAGHDKEVCRQ